MAMNLGDQGQRIYIGTGKRGLALSKTLKALAAKHTNNSLSKLLIDAAIEKYGIDPYTGELSGQPASTSKR